MQRIFKNNQEEIKNNLERLMRDQEGVFSLLKVKKPKKEAKELKKCLDCLARIFCQGGDNKEVCIALVEYEGKIYIGLSKLCCAPCQLMIDIANEKGENLEVCGTHGYIYPNWWVPNFYQSELLDKLKSIKGGRKFPKFKETTSVIPTSCLKFEEIYNKLLEQKIETKMEIPLLRSH